jgi:hypothetical protein
MAFKLFVFAKTNSVAKWTINMTTEYLLTFNPNFLGCKTSIVIHKSNGRWIRKSVSNPRLCSLHCALHGGEDSAQVVRMHGSMLYKCGNSVPCHSRFILSFWMKPNILHSLNQKLQILKFKFLTFLCNDQQIHNYFTNYYTPPTRFYITVSSSGIS